MHYVIGDIHNDLKKLKQILKQINITRDDELIVLGDGFDRGGENADPFGVYCALAGLQGKCSWIRGNHDDWLANYTYEYFNTPEKKRHKVAPYGYNSFELLRQRITEVDMRNIADLIKGLPLQKELEVDGKKYLFAHAMTSDPKVREEDRYYLMGTMDIDSFFFAGIDGYISMCGHTPTDSIVWKKDRRYLDEPGTSIWANDRRNVYLLDCGCGFGSGKLACICLETKERFYS